jgi:PAS domain S-box-containing protein
MLNPIIKKMARRKFASGKSVKNPAIYKTICENSMPSVLVLYSDYRLISANPLACSLFGMTEEELCKLFLTDLVDYNDPRLMNLVDVAERTGKVNGHITLVRKNGSKFTSEISSSSFRDENGELIIFIVIRELIDRLKEEEELHKNFALYQLAIDATIDGIWDMDMKTNRLFLSPNALNWFGYKEPKTLHRDELYNNIIHKDDIPGIENELNPVKKGHTNLIDIEFRVNTLSVGWKWIRLRGKVVLRDSEGKIIRMLGTFADISNRKQIEGELERSHKEFQSYFDYAPIGLTVATPDKSWIAVNEKACQILGYSKQELLGFSWGDLIHPNDIQEHIVRFNLALEGKLDKDTFDTRFIRKDGSIINVNLNIVCYRNEDGSVHHFLASHIDTTKQKRYEESIRNERKILRTLIDNLPFTIYVIDKEGRKVISNKADLETIGCSNEAEVLGKTDIELFPDEIGERGHADNMRVINTGLPILNREEDFFDKNGQKKWLQTNMVPLFDSDNQISGLIGIGIDITEQKSLQQKIIDSEAYYRTLVNISPNGIVVTDLKGKVTFISKRMYQIFKVPDNENYIGEFIFDWLTPESLEVAITNFKEVTEGKRTSITKEYKCVRYDKSEFWGEFCSSSLLDTSDNPIGLMIVCCDISDRKEAEAKLILALNKAEESDTLKTALLRNISHEIRTPMNAILGFSALLGEPGISYEVMMSYIETIQGSSNQLLSIINDLVDISTIEARIVKKNISDLNLNEIILSIYNQFKMRATQKNIGLNITVGLSHEKACIKTDRTKLIQIISNLLTNAIKFTEQGQINFGFTLENLFIKFWVSDTGIGIPSQYHSKIFNPFFQVESDLSRKFEGTGLGLSICKAYAELLGGTIWVTSEMGTGSSFYFTIPFEPAESSNLIMQHILNDQESIFPKTPVILIAEDDENNFKFILNLLSGLKVTTLLARNGKEALDKCQDQKNIDLVFMDLKMPQMDGYDAMKKIREFLPDLPIIAQTSYLIDREQISESGFTDYIRKPFSKSDLISKINKYLSSQNQQEK